MKNKSIGKYQSGYQYFELIIRDGTGGEGLFNPVESHYKDKCPKVIIGIDYLRWDSVVDVLMHEIIEMQLDINNLRFTKSNAISRDPNGCIFVLDHVQFTQIISKAGEFVAECLPNLAKEYKDYRRKAKR